MCVGVQDAYKAFQSTRCLRPLRFTATSGWHFPEILASQQHQMLLFSCFSCLCLFSCFIIIIIVVFCLGGVGCYPELHTRIMPFPHRAEVREGSCQLETVPPLKESRGSTLDPVPLGRKKDPFCLYIRKPITQKVKRIPNSDLVYLGPLRWYPWVLGSLSKDLIRE